MYNLKQINKAFLKEDQEKAQARHYFQQERA